MIWICFLYFQLEKATLLEDSLASHKALNSKSRDINDNQVISEPSFVGANISSDFMMSDRTFIVGLILSLVTLFVITLVIVKLSKVITLLSNRLDNIENMFDSHSKVCVDQTENGS